MLCYVTQLKFHPKDPSTEKIKFSFTRRYLLSDNTPYAVRLLAEETGQSLPNVQITIEVAEHAPLQAITDSNGFARISIDAAHAGKPSRLLIDASGYKVYRQEIDLIEGKLPDTILLRQSP